MTTIGASKQKYQMVERKIFTSKGKYLFMKIFVELKELFFKIHQILQR